MNELLQALVRTGLEGLTRHVEMAIGYLAANYRLVLLYGLVPAIFVLERVFPTRPISLLPKGWASDLFHTFEPPGSGRR
jgi:hypothetical protein